MKKVLIVDMVKSVSLFKFQKLCNLICVRLLFLVQKNKTFLKKPSLIRNYNHKIIIHN